MSTHYIFYANAYRDAASLGEKEFNGLQFDMINFLQSVDHTA